VVRHSGLVISDAITDYDDEASDVNRWILTALKKISKMP